METDIESAEGEEQVGGGRTEGNLTELELTAGARVSKSVERARNADMLSPFGSPRWSLMYGEGDGGGNVQHGVMVAAEFG